MGIPLIKTTAYYADVMTQDIALAPAATKLSGAKMGLGTGAISIGPTTLITDLIEAAFTGYARSATIVWGLPINELDGSVTSQSPSALFRCTVTGAGENIQNLFVCDSGAPPAGVILGACRITPPIPIVVAGDGFTALIDWNSGETPGNCQATIIM